MRTRPAAIRTRANRQSKEVDGNSRATANQNAAHCPPHLLHYDWTGDGQPKAATIVITGTSEEQWKALVGGLGCPEPGLYAVALERPQ
jgi:hypothetical protein